AGADATIANLESPLATCLPGGEAQRPRLCGDPEAAAPLAEVGVGAVTGANNHALDAGEAGLREAAEQPRARGGVVRGAAAARAGAPVVERLGPIHVLAANVTRSAAPPGRDPTAASPDEIAAVAKAFRAREPRAPLLVLLHGGREVDPDPSGY